MVSVALRHVVKYPLWLFCGYALAITAAETFLSFGYPQLGAVFHAILLVGLVLHGGLGAHDAVRKLAVALSLMPLTRLLSLALPLPLFPQAAWYPIVGVPLLIATWTVVRQFRLSRSSLGLRSGNIALQVLLAGGGLGIGAVEYMILRPDAMASSLTWGALLMPVLSLLVFTGFAEEIIFRGLLQSLAIPIFGRWALVYVSVIFAVLHIGSLSLVDVVFVFIVGLLFAYSVHWSGSILGVSLAHGLANVTLFLLMPLLSHDSADHMRVAMSWAIGLGSTLAVFAIGVLVWQTRYTDSRTITVSDPVATRRHSRHGMPTSPAVGFRVDRERNVASAFLRLRWRPILAAAALVLLVGGGLALGRVIGGVLLRTGPVLSVTVWGGCAFGVLMLAFLLWRSTSGTSIRPDAIKTGMATGFSRRYVTRVFRSAVFASRWYDRLRGSTISVQRWTLIWMVYIVVAIVGVTIGVTVGMVLLTL